MSDKFKPPKENLVRAVFPGPEFREEPTTDDTIGTLEGHFAVWNQWAEIDSAWEGNFLERVNPSAFDKAVSENTPKVLFQHGQDPQIGDKPLGPIRELKPDDEGMYYNVGLLDTSYNRDLKPGLEAGLYGASFRFSVVKEEFNRSAKKSAHNPKGLPERTILEATLPEFGPVTFPAYVNATAGARMEMRSMTDDFILTEALDQFIENPDKLRALLEQRGIEQPERADALPADGAASEHSDEGSRSEAPPPQPDPPAVAEPPNPDPPERGSSAVTEKSTVNTIEEVRARIDEIKSRFTELDTEIGINRKTEEQATEWAALLEERADLEARVEDYEDRSAVVREAAEKPKNRERVVPQFNPRGTTQSRVPANIYDLSEYRNLSSNDEQMRDALRDGAMRSVESVVLPHERANENESKSHIERLLDQDKTGKFASFLLATGNPVYQRAFSKMLAGQALTSEESRAVGTVGSGQNADGGFAVPYTLDPTIILTSNGQVNPLRSMARVETLTTGNTWKGVTSAGITVSRVAEESAVTPTSPTLAQPSVTVQAVKAEIQYSIEADGDWPRLQAEMARLLQDAKDAEEATQFITGNGDGTTGNPEGVVAGLATTSYVGTTGDGLTVDDIFRLTGDLPDRFEPQAQFLAHRKVYNAIREFGTGASVGEGAVWQNSLQPGQPGQLVGYPARTASGMSSDYTTTDELALLFGDFQNGYIIVDKVGLSVEIDPHVRNSSGQWTGQRALLAHYRNNAMVLVDNALRLLKIGVLVS
ncbi:MAG TPA: phage major capsid protein [Gemmatimonadales bacterium]|nr:phage major capsid protein [Gemmatimonadales bacterium]